MTSSPACSGCLNYDQNDDHQHHDDRVYFGGKYICVIIETKLQNKLYFSELYKSALEGRVPVSRRNTRYKQKMIFAKLNLVLNKIQTWRKAISVKTTEYLAHFARLTKED